MDKFITGWIRAAVGGKTADGRDLNDQQLIEIASNYNTEVYQAYVWLEHQRSLYPNDLFNALGKVVAVKSEPIKGGALDGRTALYVQLEPSTVLIDMVRKGQKLHLSLEIAPNFADMGQAYLVGLGVTDSPASLGTEAMHFNHKRTHNVFSNPVELAPNVNQWQRVNTFGAGSLDAGQVQLYQTLGQLVARIDNLSERVNAFGVTLKEYGDKEFFIDHPAPESNGYSLDFESMPLARPTIGY